jgi:hypothetical protein
MTTVGGRPHPGRDVCRPERLHSHEHFDGFSQTCCVQSYGNSIPRTGGDEHAGQDAPGNTTSAQLIDDEAAPLSMDLARRDLFQQADGVGWFGKGERLGSDAFRGLPIPWLGQDGRCRLVDVFRRRLHRV